MVGRLYFLMFLICWSTTVLAADQQVVVLPAGDDAVSLFPDWHIYGSDTLRSDVYKSKGDPATSPYRFSNAQTYDELSLNFDRSFSPFNRVTGQLSGLLYNDSLYRSSFPGSVLERMNLRQENGEFFVPYRVEAGDFFAFQSYRTIQRSLKGARLEFQPQWGSADIHQSIELFGGTATPTWDTFQYQDDFSTGASWLVQHPLAGSLATNLVLNHKQANGFAQPATKQYVYSLAWEKHAALLAQQMVIEAEAGRFIGDHPLVVAGVPNTRRQGNGYFGQVSGSPDHYRQLSYRLRAESYGQDYQPNGGAIQSDRNSQEGYLTWQAKNGLAISGRWQHFLTARQTTNPNNTITYGGNVSGTIPLFGGISGNIDGFGSSVKNRTLTSNTMAKVANINLSKSLSPDLSLRGGFYYAHNRDKNNAASGLNITRQFTGGADIRTQWHGVTGTLSPGLVARQLKQGALFHREWNPTFNANLMYGKHQLSLALSNLDQGGQSPNLGTDTITAGLNYRYTQPKYVIGMDANWYDRHPDNATTRWTNAWRLGVYITYNFDRPARQLAMATPETVVDSAPAPLIERMQVDLSRLVQGMTVAKAKTIVADAGLGAPSDQAGFLIWYARIFRDMSENQRLVLEVRGNRLVRATVIIDFFDQGDITGMSSSFERMRRQLMTQYGQPAEFFELGAFTASMPVDLAASRFIRTMEWRPQTGGILRFGIPRRLDNRIRMELQYARSFPAVRDTLWSLEEVQ